MPLPATALVMWLLLLKLTLNDRIYTYAALSATVDPKIGKETRAQLCAHFAGGLSEIPNQHDWQNLGLCNNTETTKWLDVAARNCISCQTGRNVCKRPPTLLFHQYLDSLHPKLWRANLLSMQSVLVTQDLNHTRFVIWVNKYDDLTSNPEVKAFMKNFRPHIQLRRIQWDRLIAGTPFDNHPYFANLTLLRQTLTRSGIDNDVILLRDWRPLLINVGYQFVMRYVNGHVHHVRKGSLLAHRLLAFTASIPYNDTDIQKVVKDVCEPLGYSPVSFEEYGNKDIHNICTLRYGLQVNNTGPLSNILFDYPIGWFDPWWARKPAPGVKNKPPCLQIRKDLPRDEWVHEVGRQDHAYHTRWPKKTPDVWRMGVNSPVGRSIRILEHIFAKCTKPSCLPQQAGFLADYHTLIDDLPEPWAIVTEW